MRVPACFCVYLTIRLSHQMASSKEMPNRSKRKILVKEIWEVRGVCVLKVHRLVPHK